MKLGEKQPMNGQLAEINAEISDFERRYEMPSDDMKSCLRSGSLKATNKIRKWLMLKLQAWLCDKEFKDGR